MKMINRRSLLMAFGGLSLKKYANAKSECYYTPKQPLGPFFDFNLNESTNDLTNNKKASGKIIKIKGKVTNIDCKPLKNTIIKVWQANKYGKYFCC